MLNQAELKSFIIARIKNVYCIINLRDQSEKRDFNFRDNENKSPTRLVLIHAAGLPQSVIVTLADYLSLTATDLHVITYNKNRSVLLNL